MRGWCSLKSIISLIKYNNNNEMDRETAAWCVTVAVHDAVVGRTVVGRDVVGRAVVGRDAGNLYPNSGNPGKRYRKQQHNKNEKENCLWQK